MSVPIAIAVYISIWFTVLFAILPFGVQSQEEAGSVVQPGTDPGAPMKPLLLKKALWTTFVSAVVFSGVAALMIWNQ